VSDNHVIPDAAVEEVAAILYDIGEHQNTHTFEAVHAILKEDAARILEAAYPIMLSHEREETRLAHVDAVVNAQTADKIQATVDAVLALHRELPCLDEDGDPIGGSYCEECKDLDDHSGERVHEVYPCLTVREITKALAGEETYTTMRDRIENPYRSQA